MKVKKIINFLISLITTLGIFLSVSSFGAAVKIDQPIPVLEYTKVVKTNLLAQISNVDKGKSETALTSIKDIQQTDKVDQICIEGDQKSKGKVSAYVSLGKQKVYICQGKLIVYEAMVITGRAQYPTPVGDFKILNKARDIYFNCDPGEKPRWVINGVEKCYHSDYWVGVGIYKSGASFGFHDADWWKEKQWKNRVTLNQVNGDGSHACMNTYKPSMPTVYEKLNVGDWVLIRKN